MLMPKFWKTVVRSEMGMFESPMESARKLEGYLADAEFVDQFDLLHARGIALAEYFHFERLRE